MVLDEKVAIVTGSSQGIGKAIALRLANEGANLVINYPFEGLAADAQAVVAEVQAAGRKAIAVQANVTKAAEVDQMLKTTIDTFGKVDILVNNAGITRDNLLMRIKEEDWDAVLEINLKGTYLCTKAVLRTMMKQRSGAIINIASCVGLTGNAGQANYAASKAGIIGFTKSVAQEIGSRGVTVNAVAPGYIMTEMTDKLGDDVKKAIEAKIPLERLGTPDDVAGVVAFLASPAANYLTGQTISVDGGMVMR